MSMKNGMALAVGCALLLAALLIAANTSSQDHAPRPEIAQALTTALHVTPSTTPISTFAPILAATPRHIAERDPSDQEILDLLFHYPYWGAYIIPSRSKLNVQRLALDALAPTLIITGDGAEATDGLQAYPAAFGAVLAWDNEGYAKKFLRVQFGHRAAQVAASITPDGSVVFILRDIGNGAREVSQQTIVLDSCRVTPDLALLLDVDRRWQTEAEFECF